MVSSARYFDEQDISECLGRLAQEAGSEIASHLPKPSGWREKSGIAGGRGCKEWLNPPT
ncbi:hypothetical protein [Glutamicibacter sp.]|uniref:hypothetical protein n=1 Tax=Glutamicibacter sp. TaxID=1931995 RepID=UPI003D6B3362